MTVGLMYELLNPFTDGCLTPAQVAAVTAMLRQSLIADFPSLVVKDQCGRHGQHTTTLIGVWLDDGEPDTDMTAELTRAALLRPQEQFHAWVAQDFVQRIARKKLPRTDGDDVLDGVDVVFTGGGEQLVGMRTTVHGHREVLGIVPVAGTKTIDDTFGLSPLAIDGLTPSWPIVSQTTLDDRNVTDPGLQVLAIFPTAIPFGDQNLIFDYSQGPGYAVTTTPARGLSLGAALREARRRPRVRIHGPARLAVIAGFRAHAAYSTVVEEVRAPLSFRWSSPSHLDSTTGTLVVLDVPTTGGQAGQTLSTSITVTVSDADVATLGTFSDTLAIEIDVQAPHVPHPIGKLGTDPLGA